ncbi:MAG TPA: hypothetical protein VHU88_08040 [Sporichthyaceae bacterium]|jgi:hypothetical protein|nr:hypothetical protein [Sporichthyaceae bacterium]
MRPAVITVLAAALAISGAVAIAAPNPRSSPTAPTAMARTAGPVVVPAVIPPGHPLYPLPAAAAQPQPCPLPPSEGSEDSLTHTPKVAEATLPAPVAALPRKVDLAPLAGKGMWWTLWSTSRIDAAAWVAKAKAAGLHQVWVRVGGTNQGWYGGDILSALLPAAHAAGLAVVAWDYPSLSDPVADAARADRTLDGTFGGQHIDAFSPDIETKYEGTYLTVARVALYLSLIRAAAGNIPLVATVMNPTARQLASYPYAAEAPYVDAFAPMIYWSCTEPGVAAAAALAVLARLRPVHLIGQAYDMSEDGGRHGMPTGPEEWRFLDVARSAGAIGASLFDAETATAAEWAALGAYPWGVAN